MSEAKAGPPATLPRWRVAAADAGTRLDKFLAAPDKLGSRSRVAAALLRGRVFVNEIERRASDAASPVKPGDQICVWPDRPGSSRRRPAARRTGDLRIVFEDDDLIVLDKPAGLLSVPLEVRDAAPSALEQVETYMRRGGRPGGGRKPLVVHRIDRDTSGLVVFAKHFEARQRLRDQFRRREPERVYWAVVYGCPDPESGEWKDRLVWDERASIQKATRKDDPSGVDAISRYRVLERFEDTSLIEVRLETGKRNQIRLQARRRGHTLVGEQRYVFGPDLLRPVAFPRHALHAQRLAFKHPADGRPLQFDAPLPDDLAGLLEQLRSVASDSVTSDSVAPDRPGPHNRAATKLTRVGPTRRAGPQDRPRIK
jgi:23S rRNA pseudouridine1911/1915/1917 synthase